MNKNRSVSELSNILQGDTLWYVKTFLTRCDTWMLSGNMKENITIDLWSGNYIKATIIWDHFPLNKRTRLSVTNNIVDVIERLIQWEPIYFQNQTNTTRWVSIEIYQEDVISRERKINGEKIENIIHPKETKHLSHPGEYELILVDDEIVTITQDANTQLATILWISKEKVEITRHSAYWWQWNINYIVRN